MKIFPLVFMHVLPEKTQGTFITFIIKILNSELNRAFSVTVFCQNTLPGPDSTSRNNVTKQIILCY